MNVTRKIFSVHTVHGEPSERNPRLFGFLKDVTVDADGTIVDVQRSGLGVTIFVAATGSLASGENLVVTNGVLSQKRGRDGKTILTNVRPERLMRLDGTEVPLGGMPNGDTTTALIGMKMPV